MRAYLFAFTALIFSFLSLSQTLNLPARQPGALNGHQFEATIASSTLSLANRENMVYAQVSAGNVPNFYRTLVAVTSTATINSTTQSVTYYVAPDYLAVGCDSDYFLMPISPMLATKIGNLTGTTLPTRKMVNDIWKAAAVKLAPHPLPAGSQMTTVPYFAEHDSIVKKQRDSSQYAPLGALTSGDKKDVIISNSIYTTANRVIIYGWLQTNGTAIQPMTNVHADTYMDYSHGSRLVQNNCIMNGTTQTTIQAILESATLNSLLSDEGQISQPYYPYGVTLNKPASFALLKNSSTSLKLIIKNDAQATHYNIYKSANGTTFGSAIKVAKTNLYVTGLSANQLCYVKIEAYDSVNNITSPVSEVLAAVPSSRNDSVLVVNGFDRSISGNTYNFVIQHGTAFFNNNKYIESCTNDAITDNLLALSKYRITDWLLGEESTADETFSTAEQTSVSAYLKQGGYLFTSGSEIGWDLDHSGTAADKQFYNDYLKASYAADAPGGTANSCYTSSVNPISGSVYGTSDSYTFDNGTHGTYNVSYPDVISAISGSAPDLHYSTANTDYACVHFAGTFSGGTKPGKLVYLAYPFETVYPSASRDTMMKDILAFFLSAQNQTTLVKHYGNEIISFFPNPAYEAFTLHMEGAGEKGVLQLFDISGKLVLAEDISSQEQLINCTGLSSGVYIAKVFSGGALLSSARIILCK